MIQIFFDAPETYLGDVNGGENAEASFVARMFLGSQRTVKRANRIREGTHCVYNVRAASKGKGMEGTERRRRRREGPRSIGHAQGYHRWRPTAATALHSITFLERNFG